MSGEWISPLNRSTAHINGTIAAVLSAGVVVNFENFFQIF